MMFFKNFFPSNDKYNKFPALRYNYRLNYQLDVLTTAISCSRLPTESTSITTAALSYSSLTATLDKCIYRSDSLWLQTYCTVYKCAERGKNVFSYIVLYRYMEPAERERDCHDFTSQSPPWYIACRVCVDSHKWRSSYTVMTPVSHIIIRLKKALSERFLSCLRTTSKLFGYRSGTLRESQKEDDLGWTCSKLGKGVRPVHRITHPEVTADRLGLNSELEKHCLFWVDQWTSLPIVKLI